MGLAWGDSQLGCLPIEFVTDSLLPSVASPVVSKGGALLFPRPVPLCARHEPAAGPDGNRLTCRDCWASGGDARPLPGGVPASCGS